MVWGVLWGLGVVAFFVVFFWRRLRWLLLWILGLVGIIAAAILQGAFLESPDCRKFAEAAGSVGWWVLVLAVIVLVTDLAAMIVYTIRRGKSDDQEGKLVTENRLMTPSLNNRLTIGRPKLQVLFSRSEFVSIKSLVTGTATFGERLMALGIGTLVISFFLIFVGWGLMAMSHLAILVFIPVLPGMFLYRGFFRPAWKEYKETKQKPRFRQSREEAGSPLEGNHAPHGHRSRQR